jgi:protein arginine kinase activator
MKCGKPATNKITRIENGQVLDIYLCAEHAGEASPYLKSFPLSNILEGLLKKEWSSGPPTMSAPLKPGLRCSGCGLPFDAYKKNLMLGCSECYASFREELLADLRKFHGDTHHMGRCPGGSQASGSSLRRATELPEQALADEAAGLAPKVSPSAGGQILLKDPKQAIEELTKAMQQAILAEDYTRAAIYRDQIKELKARMREK